MGPKTSSANSIPTCQLSTKRAIVKTCAWLKWACQVNGVTSSSVVTYVPRRGSRRIKRRQSEFENFALVRTEYGDGKSCNKRTRLERSLMPPIGCFVWSGCHDQAVAA